MKTTDGLTPTELSGIPLQQIVPTAWQLLQQGAKIPTHAFHTPVLSTIDRRYPESRIVVLRRAHKNRALLECHTDFRSGKIEQLERNSRSTWTFYDAQQKLQIRVRGSTDIHSTDDYADQRWSLMSDQSKRCYAQHLAAGLEVDEIIDAAPCPNIVDAEVGRKNFAIVSCHVEELEWLYLSSAGHQRAICRYTDQSWSSQWIMP